MHVCQSPAGGVHVEEQRLIQLETGRSIADSLIIEGDKIRKSERVISRELSFNFAC